jgi:2-polyprenyl-3-methyl-5-hydroxy-6-metoxy-1,4-benzoquinol methylase
MYEKTIHLDDLLKTFRSSSDQGLLDQLVKCSDCEFTWLSPRVRSEIIMQGYEEAVDPTFNNQDKFRIKTFSRVFKSILNYLGHSSGRGLNVLDVGCAGGAFPKAAHDLGCSVTGIEPSKWLTEQGKAKYQLDIRQGLLSQQNLDPGTFDIVTLWDVIEHLTQPESELQRIRSLLKTDGTLIVNFPDVGSIACRLLGFKWPFFLNVHLFYFTRRTMGMLLEKNGFHVIKMAPFWQTLELRYVLRRASATFPVFGYIEKLADKAGLGSLALTYNIGQTLVIAKKC